MRIDSGIAKSAKVHVKNYLSRHLDKKFKFHDLGHTVSVVNAVNTICFETGIDEHEKAILLVAAWFHDVGYTDRLEEHEDIGALYAEKFLREHNVDERDIEVVKNCIIATHYPQHPFTPLEMILCDADMMHLADKDYLERSQLLRNEWALTRNKHFTDAEWIRINIEFLDKHFYHTAWCKENLENRKRKNIQKLIALQAPGDKDQDTYKDIEMTGKKKVNRKSKQPEYGRGVETLFRVASSNHMRLSGMADNKAHILLSINSIIISVILSVLAKKLGETSWLIYPTALLLGVCLTTIVFAVLATRPKVAKKNFSHDQISNKEVNLLFFGNFHQLKPETYEWGMGELMRDRDYLYKTLAKDIYYMGKVLAIKYRYLNIGYMIFMYGLIASVFTFGLCFFCAQPVMSIAYR